MGKKSVSKKSVSVLTNPWFVVIVIVGCFAILTPKIFLPLLKQLTGVGKSDTSQAGHGDDRLPPNMRMHPPAPSMHQEPGEYSRAGPQFGRPSPTSYTHQSGSSVSKSFLSFLLPVYAIGIGCYMVYTLCKVFHKKEDEKTDKQEESESEDTKTSKFKFKEKSNVCWDANDGEFKYIDPTVISANSEDSEAEFERYKDLDPDYVEFLRERRRSKRNEAAKSSLESTTKASLNSDEI